MNIAMILDDSFPPDPRVENEAVSLIEQGHNVFLYCIDYTGLLPEFEIINGIKVYRHRFSRLVYKLSALAYTFPFYHIILKKSIKNFIEKHNIDTIHIHDMVVVRAVFWANKTNKRIVLDLHENRPEIMKYYPHLQKGIGKYLINLKTWASFEQKYIRKADKVIVVAKEASYYYVMKYKVTSQKFVIVPNTVMKSFYENAEINKEIVDKYKDDFTLLYIGDTGKRRGLLDVLQAINIVKKDIQNIKLVVLGQANEELESMIIELGIEDNVDLQGWQSPDSFASYISASDVCLCPIHRNIHHDTTYANKIFQYMSLGKPVLVSDCTAQKKVINDENCGLVFRAGDSKDMASKILELYRNNNLIHKLGANARKSVESKYNWNITSRELLSVYN
ncbi:MAG: glycosyltransferase family 4 protein [Flavobacteriaceae bacterium]|nr:glycosyltransferase family 4 protein [Flavobacteriaceae bacterium]